MRVDGPPSFIAPTVSSDSLSFFMVLGDKAPPLQTLSVTPGSGDVRIVSDYEWLKFNQRSLSFLDVTVDPTGLASGYYEGRLTFGNSNSVRVFFTIQAKPAINSSVANMTFRYSQYGTTLPFLPNFWTGSSVRNFPIDVNATYTNPATGNWLAVASRRGMVTPIKLTAVVDPSGLNPGTYTGAIQILGNAANSPFLIPVTLVVAVFTPPARGPEITSFANAAKLLEGAISGGEMVRLGGNNLACDATARVLVDGDAAQVLSANANEIRLIVPDSVSGKNRVPVQVRCRGDASDLFTVPVGYAAPALFTRTAAHALAFNEDDSLNGEGMPAARGSMLTVFANGLGGLDAPDATGTTPFLAPLSLTGRRGGAVISGIRAADMPGAVRIKLRLSRNVQPGSEVDVRIQSGLESAHATIAVK